MQNYLSTICVEILQNPPFFDKKSLLKTFFRFFHSFYGILLKNNVGKISQAFSEKLRLFLDKGYQIKAARVQFCVCWKGKTDEVESLIFLPEIYLEKSKTLNRIGFGN